MTNDFSISSWFNANVIYDVPGTIKMIITKHKNGITSNGYVYGIWNNANSSINKGVINFSGSPIYTIQTYPSGNSGDVLTNNWYNFIVTYSESQSLLKYYLNGNLISSVS